MQDHVLKQDGDILLRYEQSFKIQGFKRPNNLLKLELLCKAAVILEPFVSFKKGIKGYSSSKLWNCS